MSDTPKWSLPLLLAGLALTLTLSGYAGYEAFKAQVRVPRLQNELETWDDQLQAYQSKLRDKEKELADAKAAGDEREAELASYVLKDVQLASADRQASRDLVEETLLETEARRTRMGGLALGALLLGLPCSLLLARRKGREETPA